jgi:Predicted phosphohydrolase
MSVFVIADLHLSFGVNKPMDVFEGWHDYTDKLARNWRAIVKDTDTVVLAGDISWGMKLEETVKDFQYIHDLPGRKLILKGNHDYWWSTKNKIDNFFAENGFDDMHIIHNCAYEADDIAVFGTRGWLYNSKSDDDVKIVNREAGRLAASLNEAKRTMKKPVAFLHYPPVYDNMECTEILDILEQNGIEDCYYGHIHGKYAAKKAPIGEYKGIKMHLIACDYVDFCPVLVQKK